jgi:hypothetical protein
MDTNLTINRKITLEKVNINEIAGFILINRDCKILPKESNRYSCGKAALFNRTGGEAS